MEYDIKDVDYKVLEYLRKNTILGPIARLKIEKAKLDAEKIRKYYLEVEHELVELDTATADALEYTFRMNAMERKMTSLWTKYGDGLGLTEFTEDKIRQDLQDANVKRL